MTINIGTTNVDVFHLTNQSNTNYLCSFSKGMTSSICAGLGYDLETGVGYTNYIDTLQRLNTTDSDTFEINIKFIPMNINTSNPQYIFNPDHYTHGVWCVVSKEGGAFLAYVNGSTWSVGASLSTINLFEPIIYNIKNEGEGIVATISQGSNINQQVSTVKTLVSQSTYRILGGISHDYSANGFYVKDDCWIKLNGIKVWNLSN